MDQGAIKAIKIAETPNRFISGIIEKTCKKIINDKTNYIKMLTNNFKKNINLFKIKNLLINNYLNKYKKYIIENNKIYTFKYPIKKYPKHIKLIKLDKLKIIKIKLKGIKGQYLIFNNNYVLNIRNHIGYNINLKIK